MDCHLYHRKNDEELMCLEKAARRIRGVPSHGIHRRPGTGGGCVFEIENSTSDYSSTFGLVVVIVVVLVFVLVAEAKMQYQVY